MTMLSFWGVAVILLVFLAMNAAGGETPSTAQLSRPPETPAQHTARMHWWREARFGLFIHWGVYSVPAGRWKGHEVKGAGEWIMYTAKIPVADYAKFAREFNPVKFDAERWVAIARSAGMKYIVITAKHHDGFAMFDSKASTYNIVDATPFHRDPLKELAAACAKNDIKLGFYYSQAQDWHHPGGAASGGHWDKAQDGDMNEYIRTIAVPQVREILSNYGHVSILWFDTPVDMTPERAAPFIPLMQLQPGLIVNNRLGGGFEGDTETPEQYIPATGYPGRDFEVCMTMNDTWGFKTDDHDWKSTATLVHNLVDIASKGGNYLLNVGPTALGEIPQPSVERLAEIGQWMKTNGQAIYGTTASPFQRYSFDGRCTVKGSRLFVHAFAWPKSGLCIKGLKTRVLSASFIADGTPASFTATTDAYGIPILTIQPPSHPDPIATVVALDLASAPEIDPRTQTLQPSDDGTITLAAADTAISGPGATLKGGYIGNWHSPSVSLTWKVGDVPAGQYAVEITCACDDDNAGSTYEISAGTSKLTGKIESTGNWDHYTTQSLGKFTLAPTAKGEQVVTLKPTSLRHESMMNLKQIKLTPVKGN